MTLPHPLFTDGRASGIPIALWACNYKQGTLAKKFDFGFAPIVGAYVACVQVSDAQASVAIRPELIRYGRTNGNGWVVRREREALGAETDVPESRAPVLEPPPTWFLNTDPVVFDRSERHADRTLLHGLPNERYRIFWCYNEELFQRFVSEHDGDPLRALDAFQAGHYMVEPFGTPAALGSLDLMSEWERGAVPRLLFPGERRGYHAGWYFKDKFTLAIFDATPESFRALFASEWLQWCCERVVHNDPDWPYLWSLASVIRAAESGSPMPDLAKDMPGGEMGKRAEEMRVYFYKCAKQGFAERDSIVRALSIGVGSNDGWRDAARAIEDETGLVHPAQAHTTHLDTFFFLDETKTALVAYYDMYALGFRSRPDTKAIEAHSAHVHEALAWVRKKQKDLLASFGHDQLIQDLGLHVQSSDFALRVALLDRYHFQCANAELAFWQAADAKLSSQDDWDKLRPYLIWLGESSDLLSEVFSGLLERYIAVYRLRAESTETLLRYLYRYHLTLTGARAEQVLPQAKATVRLEYDPSKGRAVAKLYQGARATLLGEYELFTKVTSPVAGEAHAPLGPNSSRSGLKLFRRAMAAGQVREFVLAEKALQVPHADVLSGFPKLLASTGALIKAGLAIQALAAEAKEKSLGEIEFDIYAEVAEESLQALEPGADILQSIFVRAGMGAGKAAVHPFVRGGAALAKLGTVIESSRNLVAGAQTLATLIAPSSSSTDLAGYTASGHILRVENV